MTQDGFIQRKYGCFTAAMLTLLLCACGGEVNYPDKGTDAAVDQVVADKTILDKTKPDQALKDVIQQDKVMPDVAQPDMAIPDKAMPDSPKPDAPAPDMAIPDKAVPDMAVPDKAGPDMLIPDLIVPDQLLPDTVPPKPDQGSPVKLVDDTYAEFKQGTLSESGVKIYISDKGNVQLVDRLDVNNDGWLDLVFSNQQDGTKYDINSYVYWGPISGTGLPSKTELPTKGAYSSSVADINDDGYPDVVFSNGLEKAGAISLSSYVYWGSKNGFDKANRSDLSTVAAAASTISDLNGDGYLDIVFSNNWSGSSSELNSYVYWGPISKTSSLKPPLELPTLGAMENAVADLDKDGFLDIVFVNSQDNTTNKVNSYIYFGSSSGYLLKDRKEIQTIGSHGQAIADINKDGWLDIVVSNSIDYSAYLYYGSSNGFSTSKRKDFIGKAPIGVSVADLYNDGNLDIVLNNHYNGSVNTVDAYILNDANMSNVVTLPVVAAHGSVVADWNGDGYLDIAFSNAQNASNFFVNSYVYWNSSTGFSKTNRTELPTTGARFSIISEPGSVYNRQPFQRYNSRKHDAGLSALTCSTMTVTAWVPKKTGLKFQLRSASTAAGLDKALWSGPSATSAYYVMPDAGVSSPRKNSSKTFTLNAKHKGHRFVQYQATLTHDFGNTPVLDRVEIVCQ